MGLRIARPGARWTEPSERGFVMAMTKKATKGKKTTKAKKKTKKRKMAKAR